jgi:hypothetical protein
MVENVVFLHRKIQIKEKWVIRSDILTANWTRKAA